MRFAATAAALWLLSSLPATAQGTAEAAAANFRILDAIGGCGASRPGDEIVVCGSRRNGERYRIPQLGQRGAGAGAGYRRGEAARASTQAAESGGCGIFQGQRRCSPAEMAEAGYGEGRNPIAFVANLVARLADPDANVGPPPAIPDRLHR